MTNKLNFMFKVNEGSLESPQNKTTLYSKFSFNTFLFHYPIPAVVNLQLASFASCKVASLNSRHPYTLNLNDSV